MESIYWVLTWACHRKCKHCYDDRFRPYVREAFTQVVNEGRQAFHRIIANLPDDFSWLEPQEDGPALRRRGRLILAGGEVMLDGVREELLYPVLAAVKARYGAQAPLLSIQTTGDTLTEHQIEELLERGIWMIAIASMDDFHAGMEGDRKYAFREKILRMMEKFGVREADVDHGPDGRGTRDYLTQPGPYFVCFGAEPDQWIGEIWPRGRAWQNGLSRADYGTNFCARWAGGKGFLNHGHAGSEISIEPDGSIYPCCLKTRASLGNLTEERLVDILDDLKAHPAMQALNDGDPERMGEYAGLSREGFKASSHITTTTGAPYANLCIGCDAFFVERLGAELAERRRKRLAARHLAGAETARANP